jgi:hypothetical protein
MAAVKTDRMTFVRPYRIAPSNGYRVVCNDYGTVLHSFRSVARHMVKAKWRA